MDLRIIFSDNGTLRDLTSNLLNYKAGSELFDYTVNEDSLFIGVRFPLNSLHFKFDTPNTETASIAVKYWNGVEFLPMAEVIDGTESTGAALSQNGFIDWTPDKQQAFKRDDTVHSQTNEKVTGLGNIAIYDRFWYKIDFDATLSIDTELSWIGTYFNEDADMYDEYPILNDSQIMTRFETGKTSWEAQAVRAADLIVADLVKSNIIQSGNQLLYRRELKEASVCKTAEIIFGAFGDDFKDDKAAARKEYNSRIKKDIFVTDKDSDGRVDEVEVTFRQGNLVR